jgi:glutamate formiminotransferase
VLESVPNVSEGRKGAAVGAIGRAFSAHAALLDVHSDPDHHRSVYTLAGEPELLEDALLAGVARALELIDLRHHDGVHPRVGAVDVVPLVALVPGSLEAAKAVALSLSERLGSELGLPVFLYGEVGEGRTPAFYRRGGLYELIRRVDAGELRPAAGPGRVDERSGAVLVGARHPLVAYNVELGTDDVTVAREIATLVRESGGGLPGVQAIGLFLRRAGRVQVSMNVLDLAQTPLHEAVARVTAEAAARGVAVRSGELVGLVPASVLDAARAAGVALPGVDETRVLERALSL